ASESPVVMLSGHAALSEVGKGAFQEMRQADMAAPTVKASWTAQSAGTLGADIARALRIATSGRPGPVHVSLPFDLLEEQTDPALLPAAETFRAPPPRSLDAAAADGALDVIAAAKRPLMVTGPALAGGRAGGLHR